MRIFLFGIAVILTIGVLFVAFKPLSPHDYIEWVEDYNNGWHHSVGQDGWVIDVQQEPLTYVALHRFGKTLTPKLLKSFVREQEGEYYFSIKLSRSDGKDAIDYYGKEQREAILYYYSFEFQNAFFLIDNRGKEVKPSLFHFERDNTLKQARSFLITFDGTHLEELSKMVIHSKLLSSKPIEIQLSTAKLPDFTL